MTLTELTLLCNRNVQEGFSSKTLKDKKQIKTQDTTNKQKKQATKQLKRNCTVLKTKKKFIP